MWSSPSWSTGVHRSTHDAIGTYGMADFASVVRQFMADRGMSLRGLARAVPCDPSYLSKMLNGRKPVSPHLAVRVDDALGAGGEIRRAATSITESATPREVRSSSRADQGITEDVIDVLGRIQRLSRTVNPEIVQHLQDNLRYTIVRYEKLEHSRIVPTLLKQRAWVDELLDECSHPRQRQRLFEIAAAASGVLGYVAVGRGDYPLARAYCLEAFHLSDFAQDTNLQAWARGLQSFCEYYAGQYGEALRLAEDGLNYAQSGPQSVRLTVNGIAGPAGWPSAGSA